MEFRSKAERDKNFRHKMPDSFVFSSPTRDNRGYRVWCNFRSCLSARGGRIGLDKPMFDARPRAGAGVLETRRFLSRAGGR